MANISFLAKIGAQNSGSTSGLYPVSDGNSMSIFNLLGCIDFNVGSNIVFDFVSRSVSTSGFISGSNIVFVSISGPITEFNTGSNVIFNVNDHPNVSVFDAIGASMCIPILSKPVIINDKYYVDGYLTNNFPIEIFSHINSEFILGVGVNTTIKIDIDIKNISFINYYINIFQIMYNNTDTLCYYNKIKNHKNIIYINNSPAKSILNPNITDDFVDFSLDEEVLNNLYLQGFKAMNDYSNNNRDLAFDERSSNFQDI
jgi:predicted acylesterase/phospholipase RssA